MATTLPYFKPRTQKWLSIASLVAINFLPMILAHFIIGLPFIYMFLAQTIYIGISYLFERRQDALSAKSLDSMIQLYIEEPSVTQVVSYFKTIVSNLSKKANIPPPELVFKTESIYGSVASTASMGSKNYIDINPNHCIWFMNSTKQATTPTLAHEISHIINRDHQVDAIINILNKTLSIQKKILYVAAISSLLLPLTGLLILLSGATLEFFWLSLTLTSLLAVSAAVLNLLERISLFVNGTYNRATEYLADEGAVQLTNDPVHVALLGYEIKYEILNRMKVELEDNNPLKQPITALINNIETLASKKKLSKGFIYQQACKWLKNDKKRLPPILNQFNDSHTHPSSKQRLKAIKLSAPKVFEAHSKLTKSDFYPQQLSIKP